MNTLSSSACDENVRNSKIKLHKGLVNEWNFNCNTFEVFFLTVDTTYV